MALHMHCWQCSPLVRTGKRGKRNPWLESNYAPVRQELLEVDLPVEGTLPAALDGAYVRNGPNPLHQPIGGHHWCALSMQSLIDKQNSIRASEGCTAEIYKQCRATLFL